jgi:intein/homing endonuclease
VNACNSQLKVGFSETECKELYTLLYRLKCSVAGRFLWQLGTGTVERLGLPSLQNCSFTVIDEPIRPFTWCMNFLMLGCVPPETPVLCETGIKAIKDISLGDKVWSYNIKLGEKELREVIGLHDPVIPQDMNIKLNCKYGSLTTSKKHPILVYRNKNWEYVKAGEIKVGDILQKYHVYDIQKDIVEDIETHLNIPENWKDITVESNNNYYAGEGSLYCTHNCGVGYRLLPSDVEKLPEVKYALITRKDTKDADFIVPDSREGWIKLLAKVLKAHFYSGKGFTYSCINLRSKGAPIKTFGGIASGPDVLCDGMKKISDVLNKRAGQKARPIDCLDIMNIIGMIVVSGNVRRSAQIAIGDCKDKEFLNAKNWALGNIPNWRAYSNNSVVCNDIKDILDNEDFWKGYDGTSEPYGLINLKLSKSCGRTGETQYPDPDVDGYNPCLSGDTLIAVADGRNYVKISQLVEEGKDVPVYSMDKETGEVSIQLGRNPRITGVEKELVRLTFESGQYVDITPNHKFFKIGNITVQAENLKKGDILPGFKNNVIVEKVEKLSEKHTVYNITVDTNHTFAIITKPENELKDSEGVYSSNCGEQSLNSMETCCLAEVFLPNITSKEELYKCVEYLYRICKHSLTLPCKDSEETERVVHKNMRMGIGVTGYLQATEEQRCWLPECYKYIREFDKVYSQSHGFPTSIKLSTSKPGGTLSLLGNTTPGVHPGFARYYLRRIRISSESQLIKIAKEHGYPVEYSKNFDGTFDHNTQIITFPHKLPDDTFLAENCSAVDQLNWVKRLQRDWSDNSVSVTVYYRKHELPEIKEWLKENYNTNIKTVSFLLHSDHGFIQAPMEQITKEEYEKLASQCRPITDLNGICYVEDTLEADCANGNACPIK